MEERCNMEERRNMEERLTRCQTYCHACWSAAQGVARALRSLLWGIYSEQGVQHSSQEDLRSQFWEWRWLVSPCRVPPAKCATGVRKCAMGAQWKWGCRKCGNPMRVITRQQMLKVHKFCSDHEKLNLMSAELWFGEHRLLTWLRTETIFGWEWSTKYG